jgi:hypothetical protein
MTIIKIMLMNVARKLIYSVQPTKIWLLQQRSKMIMLHDNKMTKETKSMLYDPAKSVLKYKLGDDIKLKEEDFELLFEAFFSEMERKFVK